MIKVERSYPAPASLALEREKTSGSYNLLDVVTRLRKDFHDKCYICEMKGLQDPEVEHLLPHENGKYPDRKFDWDNLFWSCGHCNKVKNTNRFREGILDCCKEDPESYIRLEDCGDHLEASLLEGVMETPILARTIALINDVFNKDNTGMRDIKRQVRYSLLKAELNTFYKVLGQYRKEGNSLQFRSLRGLLDRSSPFAGAKRSYLRDHLNLNPELAVLLE